MPFRGERELLAALAAVTAIGVLEIGWLQLPPLYASGVRYATEVCRAPAVPGACERFLTPAQCYAEREGDCASLASWRAAELLVRGERARAIPQRSRAGWHVVVVRADGSIEDPSRILGMKG